MDLSTLIIAVAFACSLPAALVLVAVLVQRPASGAWLRKHARAFAWFAAIGWGISAVRKWYAPGEYAGLAAVIALICMVCMTAFAISQRPVPDRPEAQPIP